jgi:hypothetical protein
MKVSVVTDEVSSDVETHRRPKVDSTHSTLRRLQTMLAATEVSQRDVVAGSPG